MSERVLFRGRVGTWVAEDVRLPNGNEVTLETLRHPGAAAIVPFRSRDRVLLLRQYRHAVGGYLWEVPAGKLDPGERAEACAARELEEETGFRAGRIEATGSIVTAPGFTDERIWLFTAHDLVPGRVAHERAEVIEVHELPLAEALAMIDRGEICDAKSTVALLQAARRAGGRSLR
jgi:ADP-ribose pyrophosphatase